MKKFILLLGAVLFVVGLRLYNNGLINCGYDGKLSYGTFDTKAYDLKPLLVSGPHRMDIKGNEEAAYEIMDNLSADLKLSEEVEGIKILYAYSPRLSDEVDVHGKKVNLMIAVKKGEIAVGTPLLYGSY